MKIAFCVDDNNGMLFNNRRLSRDSAVICDLLNSVPDGKIMIHPFSEKLFTGFEDRMIVNEHLTEEAGDDELCFIENIDPGSFAERISGMTVYRWNRRYPSDMKLTLSMEGFELVLREEFKGSSHERITKEVYTRCEK